MIHVREINDPLQLAEVRPAWRSLLARTPQASYFQTLDWLESYLRHHGRELHLRVLVAYDDSAPVGILPMVLRREPTVVGQLDVLTYPLHDWGTFYGPIGANPTLTLSAGLQYLKGLERDWDLLDLRWVDRDGIDQGRSSQALRGVGFESHEQHWATAAIVDLDGNWDRYWLARPQHHRANMRRAERLLAEEGEVRYVRYRPAGSATGDADPRWDLYDACENVAAHSWQGSATDGTTLTHAEVRSFLRDAHEAAAAAGGLDLNLLYVGDRPAAFAYCYHFQGNVAGLRLGFDADVTRSGAGGVLLSRLLADSCARGDRVIDLGIDYLHTKRYWKTRLAESYRYTHFAPGGIRRSALRVARQAKTWWWQTVHGSGDHLSPVTT
jgi:CelD/BcsL family acetyltransferase involved in cellulose biosynthesis